MIEDYSDSARRGGESASAGQEDRRGVEPGDPALTRGDSTGITPTTPAEEALRIAGESFRHLVEQSPFGVYAVDADFRLVMVSAGAQKVFQNVQPLIGRDFEEVMRILWSEPFVGEALGYFRHTLATGEPYHAPSTVEKRADIGETESYDWKLERVVLPDGRHGVVCHFYDLSERQRYEAALRESEARFKDMADTAPAMLWITEPDGKCSFMSRGWFGYTGQSEAEALGLGWLDAVHPDDREHSGRIFQTANERREEFALDYRLRRTDGTYRWMIDAGRPRFGPDGTFLGYIGSVIDVHERKEVEDALRASQTHLQLTTEAARIGTWDWDIAANRVDWSAIHKELWGYEPTPDPITYEQWADLVDRTDLERIETSIADCLEGRATTYDVEYRIRPRGTAQARWIRSVGRSEWKEGKPASMRGASFDITAAKQSEEALRLSEERFRTLADNISQFAWMADANGWIFWYNRRWFDYTGTTLEDMQGWGWKKVHHPDHVDRVVDKFSIHIASGKEWEDTFPLRGTDGQYRWFLSRAVPIRDAEGRITRWFGTNTDVTEQRAAEEALREADRRKDEFLAMLAHELRNPLGPIRSAVQILRKVGSPEPLAKTARDVIDRQTVHMSRLVDELLDVSRASRAKIQLRTELCDLAAIVQQSAEDFRATVEGNGLRLKVDLPQHPLFVNGDPTRLSQVVGNLLQNAIKFTDGGGLISVHASADAGTAVVTVKDTGVGMEPGLIARLFEAFTQADRSLDRSRGGLGLGLALVKGLIEMHGGTVSAYSDGPGKGSTLRFNLPLSDEVPAPSVEAVAGVSQRGLRILIIEDNPDAAESVRMLLALEGHLVETAVDGPNGLERARDLRPHVVLCDIGLPGEMDGYAVARTLRAEPDLAPLHLVALTGYGQEEDLRRAIDAGFDHHLVKPAEYEDLTAIFDSIFL